jgi:glycosyltransferase A (GT-A) superfamily protein (DUF2064 family)
MAPVLAIMTRSTSDPRIKSRLAARLPSAVDRRALALGFLDDLIDRCQALNRVALRLAVTPPAEGLRFDRPGLPSDVFVPQRGVSLAERQRHVFEDLATSGFTRVVMVGANIPDVPIEYLRTAFAKLAESPELVVYGPTSQGGCYLIGASVRPGAVPDIFAGIRWRTANAADDLAQGASQLGLTPYRLEPWNDIDTPDDLDTLVGRLGQAPAAAPHTTAVLKALKVLL